MALTSSMTPLMSSALAPHIAALVCRAPMAIANRQIGVLAQTRSFSCRTSRHPLFAETSMDGMKKMMDFWMDAHENKMKQQMKWHKHWIDRFQERKSSDPRLNKDLMKRFKRFMDLTMDTMEKTTACTSRAKLHPDQAENTQTKEGARPSDDVTRESSDQSSTLNSSDLNITVYQSGEATSVTRIPKSTLTLAGKFAKACAKFHGQDQDLRMDEVMRLIQGSNIQGTILKHEHPEQNLRTVIFVGEASPKTVDTAAPSDLKIRTYTDGDAIPTSITTISGRILCRAEKVIPASASEAMRKHGVVLDEVVRFSTDPHAKGVVILDHEDLQKKERVVISLE